MKPRITQAMFVNALRQVAEQKPSNGANRNEVHADQEIPVLGIGDWLVAVSAQSHNAASAFKLLEWLASADISSQLASTDKRLTPARPSLASSPKWHGSELTAGERKARAAVAEELLSQQRVLIVPRIPGIDEYMAALDDAVNSVVKEGASSDDALAKTAARWDEITEARGRDPQRAAYLKHLGLDE
jgi:ABC-type glycerol-3-phosphate transport system substrate-binding protein